MSKINLKMQCFFELPEHQRPVVRNLSDDITCAQTFNCLDFLIADLMEEIEAILTEKICSN